MPSADPFEVFARLDPPIWLVTAAAGSHRGGLIATFVNQASITPNFPRVVVGLARQHFTWELVEQSRCFALHLLGEKHLEWVWHFGLQTGKEVDKFATLDAGSTPLGNPLLPEVLAWLDCRVETSLNTGDRTIYLAEATSAGLGETASPLTLKRMLALSPPEKLTEMKRQMERDQEIDTAAIKQWRPGEKR